MYEFAVKKKKWFSFMRNAVEQMICSFIEFNSDKL